MSTPESFKFLIDFFIVEISLLSLLANSAIVISFFSLIKDKIATCVSDSRMVESLVDLW